MRRGARGQVEALRAKQGRDERALDEDAWPAALEVCEGSAPPPPPPLVLSGPPASLTPY